MHEENGLKRNVISMKGHSGDCSPDAKRGHRPIGRVFKAHPGKDGLVRVVEVQIGKNVNVRPVHHMTDSISVDVEHCCLVLELTVNLVILPMWSHSRGKCLKM